MTTLLLGLIDCDLLKTCANRIVVSELDSLKPYHADILCSNGMSEVVNDWFKRKVWPSENAFLFITYCKEPEPIKIGGMFIFRLLVNSVMPLSRYYDKCDGWTKDRFQNSPLSKLRC